MSSKSVLMCVALLMAALVTNGRADTRIIPQDSSVAIENRRIRVAFDLREGTYCVLDLVRGVPRLKDAGFIHDRGFTKSEYEKRVPKLYPASYSYESEKLQDVLGSGVRLKILKQTAHKYRPVEILFIDLYDDAGFVALGFGIRNQLAFPVRLKEAIVCDGVIPASRPLASAFNLNGGAGQAKTTVKEGVDISALNMAFVTYRADGQRYSVTAGGLQTYEFIKNATCATVDGGINLELTAYDPVGRLIDAGAVYESRDRFYVDLVTEDAFASLEQYGQAVRKAHAACPRIYSFPTVCGWATQNKKLGSGIPINNSAGMVEEMDIVKGSGFLDYSPVAVRIEPDYYCYGQNGDTQQGWYDDKHWAQYNTLRPPYETMEKFCRAVIDRGGIPFTYFQVGMPSNDFAVKHPDWMLRNDISRLHVHHPHHMPLVSYDFTDQGLQDYMRTMWQRLKAAGIKGIKFDYPETGWHPEGGFDDRFATAVSAYRKYYALGREGLGPDAYLHERLLGATETPLMEATIGLVDLQRVTGDGSHFVPEMVSKIGLRWYKNRVLYNYYPDSKAIAKPDRPLTTTQLRTLLSSLYMVSARLELASSFRDMSPEVLHALSRVYPAIPENTLVRPVDMFVDTHDPRIYALEVESGWQQVLIYNYEDEPADIQVQLSGDMMTDGALGLQADKAYYVHDFWNDRLLGRFDGSASFVAKLDAGEALVYSVRQVVDHPQLLSTDRHIMQGYLDMKDVRWDSVEKTLSGIASVIAGEPYKFTLATNGANAKAATADQAETKVRVKEGLVEVTIESAATRDVAWRIMFR